MKKIYVVVPFIISFSLYTNTTSAQIFEVRARVLDSLDKSPLVSANVILTALRDSTVKYFASTDVQGKFNIRLAPKQSYQLKIRFLGYSDFDTTLIFTQAALDLDTLLLAPKTSLLKQVEVLGQSALAKQKGDTVELSTKAYKTNRDASAEDLLKKMPGFTIENGNVQAQGENVGRVLVDGKEFFGDDAAIALRNLPSEVIDKIQVFDRLSEQSQFSGFDDGNTIKTINIVTKADKRNGQFGKIYGGYGIDDRYQAGANVNYFKNTRRISVIGLSNNINQQNFSSQDLVGVSGNQGDGGGNRGQGGGRQGGGNRGGGQGGGGQNNVNNFLVGQQSGITTTHSLGVNYSDNWGKKVTATGSYFFNQSNNVNNQTLARTLFLANNLSQFYEQTSSAETKNQNHRLNLRIEYKIDSANSLLITPRLSLQTNQSLTNVAGANSQAERQLLNSTQNTSSANAFAYNFGSEILFRHAFKKRGRTYSVSVTTNANSRESESFLLAQNQFFQTNGASNTNQNQKTNQQTNGYTLVGNLSYTEPLTRRSILQFEYNLSYNNNYSERKTNKFNQLSQEFVILDTLLSNIFDNDYLTQRGGVSYRVNQNRKMQLTAGFSYQNSELIGEQLFPKNNLTERTFNNVLPNLNLRYNFSTNKNLRLIYRTSVNAPSINQLQNVINNSNPLFLSTGNPDLKQSYNHNLSFRYSANNPEKATTFFTFLNINQIQNGIGNATFIASRDTLIANEVVLKRGSQLSQPINLNGLWNVNYFTVYGLPIKKLKITLNFNTRIGYSRLQSLINSNTNISDNYTVSQGINIASNISENIDFNLSYTGSYNVVANSIQAQLNNNYYSQSTNFRTNFLFKNFLFQNDISHTWFTGLTGGFNQNFLLWNMSIGKKFWKQAGELKISVFDLLNQNNSIVRNVADSYLEDVRTQVLRQYYMLIFTYNLRMFK